MYRPCRPFLISGHTLGACAGFSLLKILFVDAFVGSNNLRIKHLMKIFKCSILTQIELVK